MTTLTIAALQFGPLLIQADADATRREYAGWEPTDSIRFMLSEHPDILRSLPDELRSLLEQVGIDPAKPSALRVGRTSAAIDVEWVFFGPPWWPEDDFPAYDARLTECVRVWVYADGVAARPGFALRQRWSIAAQMPSTR